MPNGLLRIQLIRFPPRIALLAVLAAAGTVDAVEAAQAAQTGVPLDQALAQGNPSLVAAALQAMPHDATTAAMVRSQLSYDLPTVMASALRCRDLAMAHNSPAAAASCGKVAYRAALVLGDAKATFAAIAWMKNKGYPAVGRPPLLGNAFDGVDLEGLARSLPESTTDLAKTGGAMPYENEAFVTGDQGAAARQTGADIKVAPTVAVTINGKPSAALVDTGSAYAVMMDRTHADALDVKTLVTGLPPMPTMGAPPVGDSLTIGRLDTLVIGPLTLRNLLVLVVPSGNQLTDRVIVGLPVLARLRKFEFRKSSLVVNERLPPCREPLPLTYASTWDEDGKVVFDVTADGRVVKANIDTGLASLLAAGKPLIPPNDGTHAAAPGRRYLKLSVGSANLSDDSALLEPDMSFPAAFIGAPVIATFDVRLDFTDSKFCLSRRAVGGSHDASD